MLILREVLGFTAKETAEMLVTTVASVNSALQRARAAVDERVPDQSQQQTLRLLGDENVRTLVNRYVDAWERCDIDAFAAMLTEDATFAMPPLATWYRGREGIATWATLSPLSGAWRWRTVLTRANGQPALAFYAWDHGQEAYLPFALNVLTLRGGRSATLRPSLSARPRRPGRRPTNAFPSSPPILGGSLARSSASTFPSGFADGAREQPGRLTPSAPPRPPS